jgi:hypothetical protein
VAPGKPPAFTMLTTKPGPEEPTVSRAIEPPSPPITETLSTSNFGAHPTTWFTLAKEPKTVAEWD